MTINRLNQGTTNQVLVKAISGQTTNLLELQDSSGNVVSSIGPTGAVGGSFRGKVIQIVYGSTSTFTVSSSTSYSDTTLTANITPTSVSNKILVFVSQNGGYKSSGNSQNGLWVRLLRGATVLATFSANDLYTGTTVLNGSASSITYEDSPNSTSALTYKTQFRNQSASAEVGVQTNGALSTIVLMEVTP